MTDEESPSSTAAVTTEETAAEPKLPWYVQAWLALPLVLVVVGGGIGGGCGAGAWVVNQKVYRATRNPILRYVWTGLISIAAAALYFILASFVLTIIGVWS
ncbi:hypothetical protein [Paludisphaera rhizosphaerae]|uniref:hypothetical protein n=1 Tax=Paludisphaera rhizosphaerae TaxID=2711216 RepID=UPI0013EB3F7F|nr:hypothetical protein [Paludisphaera rhizosphaerae]